MRSIKVFWRPLRGDRVVFETAKNRVRLIVLRGNRSGLLMVCRALRIKPSVLAESLGLSGL